MISLEQNSLEQNPTSQQLPAVPFYRRREGIIVIIIIILIVIGATVGGAVGGTRILRLAAQRDGTTAGVQAVSVNVTTSTTSVQVVSTTVTTSTTAVSTTMTTSTTATFSAPSPTPSNCVWEGTAPFCDGKCGTGFTQIKEDNCGNGDCCWTGFKSFCCQL